MAKLLNLDEVIESTEVRVLKFAGKKHPMAEMNVKDFIELSQRAETAAKASEGGIVPLSEQIKEMVSMVKSAFPTLTQKQLDGFSLQQLSTIIKFAQAQDEEELENDEEKK